MPNSRKSRESISENLQTLVKDGSHLIQSKARNAMGETRDVGRRLGRQVNDLQHSVSRTLKKRAHSTDRAIHRSPYPVLGASLLIGLVMGLFFRRR